MEEELETQSTASQIGYKFRDTAELNCVMKLQGIGSTELKRMWGGMPESCYVESGEVRGQGGGNWEKVEKGRHLLTWKLKDRLGCPVSC